MWPFLVGAVMDDQEHWDMLFALFWAPKLGMELRQLLGLRELFTVGCEWSLSCVDKCNPLYHQVWVLPRVYPSMHPTHKLGLLGVPPIWLMDVVKLGYARSLTSGNPPKQRGGLVLCNLCQAVIPPSRDETLLCMIVVMCWKVVIPPNYVEEGVLPLDFLRWSLVVHDPRHVLTSGNPPKHRWDLVICDPRHVLTSGNPPPSLCQGRKIYGYRVIDESPL